MRPCTVAAIASNRPPGGKPTRGRTVALLFGLMDATSNAVGRLRREGKGPDDEQNQCDRHRPHTTSNEDRVQKDSLVV